MDKNKLIPGKKYLRRRKTMHQGQEIETESWLECIQVTPAGAIFFGAGNLVKMTDEQISEEIIREA